MASVPSLSSRLPELLSQRMRGLLRLLKAGDELVVFVVGPLAERSESAAMDALA